MESRARAKKREAHNFRGLKPTLDPIPNPIPVVTQTSALSTPQYDQAYGYHADDDRQSISSMDTLKRDCATANIPNRERSSTPGRRQQQNNTTTARATATATTATATTTTTATPRTARLLL